MYTYRLLDKHRSNEKGDIVDHITGLEIRKNAKKGFFCCKIFHLKTCYDIIG